MFVYTATDSIQNWHDLYGLVVTFATILVSVLLVPVPVLHQFNSSGSIGDHSPSPHLNAFLGYMLWILYGLPYVHPNGGYIITANGAGCFIALFYLVVFSIYSKSWVDKRRRIFVTLLVYIIIVDVIGATVFTVAPVTKLRRHIFGIVAMIYQIGTYIDAALTLVVAINSNQMERINGILTACDFNCYPMWVFYAAMPLDLYILVPSVLGFGLAFVQMTVYHRYRTYMMKVHGIDVDPPCDFC